MSSLCDLEIKKAGIFITDFNAADTGNNDNEPFYTRYDRKKLIEELKKSNDRCDAYYQAYRLSLKEIHYKANCTASVAATLSVLLFIAHFLFADNPALHALFSIQNITFLSVVLLLAMVGAFWAVLRFALWVYTAGYYEYLKQPGKIRGRVLSVFLISSFTLFAIFFKGR